MSARQQSTSRVAELVKIAKATKGWGASMGTKRVYFTAPDNTRYEVPINPGERLIKETEASLVKAGLPMSLPSAPAHPEKDRPVRSRAMISRYAAMDEIERAKTVWVAATNYAKKHNVSLVEIEGRTFFKIVDKPLSFFIHGEFGVLPYQGQNQQTSKPIYGFLRTSANALHVSGTHNGEVIDDEAPNGYWLVSVEWHEEPAALILFRSPRKPDSIDRRAARLSPKEAGEDREPAPVTVTQVVQQATAAPEPKPETKPERAPEPMPPLASSVEERKPGQPVEGSTSEYAQYAVDDGFLCPECSAEGKRKVTTNPQGLAAHRKSAHGIGGTTYKPSVVAKISADSPLADVGSAFDLLRAEIDKVLTTVGDGADLKKAQADVTQARKDLKGARSALSQAKSDADHQRKRAEAAEGTLRTVREALETLPMSQAFAKIADVTPHFED